MNKLSFQSSEKMALRVALESSGADFGLLALLRGGQWCIRAAALMERNDISVTDDAAVLSQEILPTSIAQAVARTQRSLCLDDLREGEAVRKAGHFGLRQPRSILCVPMMKNADLVGVLYLESCVVPCVFTAARVELLEVTASQAAFAIENARLYEELIDQGRQRARAEERLRVALGELERASRLKAMGELLASIVHEVGQPLSAIDTAASAAGRWLQRAQPDIAEATAMINQVGVSAKRARHIVQGLRAMVQRTEPEFGQVDLCEALRECVTLLSSQLSELQVRLSVSASDVPCRVRGDRIQLQQVVMNLLMNGAEAMMDMPVGDRALSLSCRVREDGGVDVAVEDRGVGIPVADVERVVQPFYTTKSFGMGMGLAICKSIVEAHGGKLQFQPGAVAGTRVTFHIPGLESQTDSSSLTSQPRSAPLPVDFAD